jgi:enoyl-[acyl-carrier protein] reductase I
MDDAPILIVGVADERSLATGILRASRAAGRRVLCTWQDERRRSRVERVCAAHGAEALMALDVSDASQLAALAQRLHRDGVRLAGVAHAVAFARFDPAQPGLTAVDGPRFAEALAVSAGSFPALLAAVRPHLTAEAAAVALSYVGAVRVRPGYDLMGVAKAALESAVRYLAAELGPAGIRVNAVSAGPVRTLAASAVPGFAERQAAAAATAPLRRNVSADEVGQVAAFLLSPAASAITGQTIYADAGWSIL